MITMPNADLDLASLAVPKTGQEERSKLGQDDFLMLMQGIKIDITYDRL